LQIGSTPYFAFGNPRKRSSGPFAVEHRRSKRADAQAQNFIGPLEFEYLTLKLLYLLPVLGRKTRTPTLFLFFFHLANPGPKRFGRAAVLLGNGADGRPLGVIFRLMPENFPSGRTLTSEEYRFVVDMLISVTQDKMPPEIPEGFTLRNAAQFRRVFI